MFMIIDYVKDSVRKFVSFFALSMPDVSSIGITKKWVTDSLESEIYAKFRSLNCGLGNRYPTLKGFYSQICVFCHAEDFVALNNEVHLVVECPHFEEIRNMIILGTIINCLRTSRQNLSSVCIYRFILNDQVPFTTQKAVRKTLTNMYHQWNVSVENMT